MVFRSLGLKRPKLSAEFTDRIPPGQYLTDRWPVLHYGDVPAFNPDTWRFRVFGAVEHPIELTWEQFGELPVATVTADMHCVTRWSKLDMVWQGVAMKTIIDLVRPTSDAKHVLFIGESDYTANVPISVATDDDVLLATGANGETLEPDHGYPLRAVVPKRYAWKSAKWLRAIEFMTEDRPGFWENYGYNNNADFWKEERFG